MPHPPACDGEAVITVVELLAMTGGVVLPSELDRVRQLIPRSSLRDALGDVVSAAIDSFRRELAASIPAFHPPPRLGGCFTACRLAEVAQATINDAFSALGGLSTLRIVRVTHCDIAIACIEDPTTGRFYELDGDLQSWLHGDEQSPGDPEFWIGEAIDDFTRVDLHPTGPHTYLLMPNSVPTDAVLADLATASE
ncbi:hypothetical protein [Nocardia iowensis]|uniref:Uncharacterized protein n=1 Tax=Nocardia iowensis TaxID=204891 RepID=A0ABX8RYN2_NOCIO|nr:hypothetical protein [Nocardia iowensis]QXN94773.1 hypothetical protein KV110_18015 [Nocardia iowensis]